MSFSLASKRRWRHAVVAAGLLCALTPSWAGGPWGWREPPMGGHGGRFWPAAAHGDSADRMVEHLGRGLDLQPSQREQLRALAEATRSELQRLREQARALRQERHQLLAAPTLDEAALEALRQRELTLHDALTARMNRFMIDAAKVLTPEQRQRWAERMQRHGDRGHRHDSQSHERHRHHPDR
ncbi:Spy/CpxP family protein refolding chaperone [Tepidimonas charontis]|uniref:Heavy-metal resistance n=1 Tax=Tepidimonas charontis TaxID=2267262 RepID=A0A554XEL9_9BURK|nr:Spy/CpxP family protein refolding chaperone [Tepidimonas charontis]TSE34280.1 Heavy-metal resistance [Tepidimonas charontis]